MLEFHVISLVFSETILEPRIKEMDCNLQITSSVTCLKRL